jgi:hypothetical protein
MNTNETTHYENPEWNFALDVPAHWHTAPPVPANSPYEVIRFVSRERVRSNFLTIVFRETLVFLEGRELIWSLKWHAEQRGQILARNGYTGFAGSEATIRAQPAWRLDFEKAESWGTWNCRYYFIESGGFLYRLGFGTSAKADMFPAFDEVAQTFMTHA